MFSSKSGDRVNSLCSYCEFIQKAVQAVCLLHGNHLQEFVQMLLYLFHFELCSGVNYRMFC